MTSTDSPANFTMAVWLWPETTDVVTLGPNDMYTRRVGGFDVELELKQARGGLNRVVAIADRDVSSSGSSSASAGYSTYWKSGIASGDLTIRCIPDTEI